MFSSVAGRFSSVPVAGTKVPDLIYGSFNGLLGSSSSVVSLFVVSDGVLGVRFLTVSISGISTISSCSQFGLTVITLFQYHNCSGWVLVFKLPVSHFLFPFSSSTTRTV